MKQITISVLLLGLLFSSCSKKECPDPADKSLTPVSFSPEVVGIHEMNSRANKATWTQGDQIAIFSDIAIKKNGNTSTSSITYTRGATEGDWSSPDANERWYFSDAIHEHNFYAYYPVGTATSYTAVEIPDISGQDGTKTVTDLKEENDFMRGSSVTHKDDLIASLQMVRVYSIINLNIHLKQDAFTDNEATLSAVKFISTGSLPLVNPTPDDIATVDLSSGHVTCTNGLTEVTLQPAAGFNLTPTSISVPVKIYAHHSTIQVQFTINGKTSAALPLSTTNFVGGRVYNYSVEINAGLHPVGIGDPIIFDWIDNNGNPIAPIIPD